MAAITSIVVAALVLGGAAPAAAQLHAGEPMQVQFRNIWLKRLQ